MKSGITFRETLSYVRCTFSNEIVFAQIMKCDVSDEKVDILVVKV